MSGRNAHKIVYTPLIWVHVCSTSICTYVCVATPKHRYTRNRIGDKSRERIIAHTLIRGHSCQLCPAALTLRRKRRGKFVGLYLWIGASWKNGEYTILKPLFSCTGSGKVISHGSDVLLRRNRFVPERVYFTWLVLCDYSSVCLYLLPQ